GDLHTFDKILPEDIVKDTSRPTINPMPKSRGFKSILNFILLNLMPKRANELGARLVGAEMCIGVRY
ncbi:hypothetical protein, partial [Clostridioides difficile]|uniref:hypothetical protein n=1 Tax=Clostridioides difficile TaxID=1496 RepID=UPI001A9C00CA